MITLSNLYQICFNEEYGSVSIPHAVLFNITQISVDETKELVRSGEWEYDDRLIELSPKQVKYLQDKVKGD